MEQWSRGVVRQLRSAVRGETARGWRTHPQERDSRCPGAAMPHWPGPAAESRGQSQPDRGQPDRGQPDQGQPDQGQPEQNGADGPSWPDWSGHAVIERRLVRRAEALWLRIGDDSALPHAGQAASLMRPPFGPHALLCEAAAGAPLSIVQVGPALLSPGGFDPAQLSPGGFDADSRLPDPQALSPTGRRLVELGGRAMRLGRRCWFDTDTPEDKGAGTGPDSVNPHFLVRAIGLPFEGAISGGPGRTAVVIASWRKLLSTEETRALHDELAAALDWLKHQLP